MKPPPRTRKTPNRTGAAAAPEAPRSAGSDASKWPRAEQNKLLAALKALHKTAEPHRDVDYPLLEARLPSRPPAEIRSAVELLKKQAISSAAARLRQKTKKEQKEAKPIETWTQLAARVTGSHEEVVSSAFSQVLMVSSTEPCTLRNSDPPLDCGPVARPSASGQACGPSVSPAKLPGAGTTGSVVTTAAAAPPPAAAHRSSGREASGTAGGNDVVNFERIYCFLSSILRPCENFQLTPMESAVVLDLLMALPEELPLLDCNKLHTHFTQVFRCFSAPGDSRTARQAFRELKEAETRSAAPQPRDAGGQSEDGLHVPPLNPFMVPLTLLQRR